MKNGIQRAVVSAVLGAVLAGCVTVPVTPAQPLPPNAIKPVIAVSSFDDRSGFGSKWDVGGGMADLLTSELMKTDNFRVVERRHLDKVFGEIKWQKDPRFRPEGKVERGRLKNAEYLIRGVINDFSQVGGGSLFVAMTKYLLGGKGNRARVAMTLTIVNIESGEILDSVQCAGSAWARKAYAKGEYGNVDFGGKAFFNTPLGSATASAIRKGVRALAKKVPRLYWEPVIADVIGGSVVLNGGKNRDLKVGDEYTVCGEGRRVTDPVTGDVLTVMPGRNIGRLRIIRVDDTISFAEPVLGEGFVRGQRLKLIVPVPTQ